MKTAMTLLFTLSFSMLLMAGGPKFKLPKVVKKYKIGMKAKKFERKNKDAVTMDDGFGFRKVYEEKGSGDVSAITYYLDDEGKQPLYEYIIEFKPDFDVKTYATELYGKPNSQGGEWRFESKKGTIAVWIYQQKLVIAAALPGSEWEDEGW